MTFRPAAVPFYPSELRLSIAISTRNRADYIGETLDSILPQLPPDAELVVFDGASTDTTPAVLAEYASRHPALRYIRATTNSGIDADYDNAVGQARGDYVWLFGDDDLLLPGAVARVLALLANGPDLVVVDAEVRDVGLGRILNARRLPFAGTRTYGPADTDALLADAGNALSFIGGTIIRRSLWLARERTPYYGTLFIHVGIVFQAPLTAIVLGEALVAIRYGNATWSARTFEIWMRLWPEMIWSLPAADWAKTAVVARDPTRRLREIARMRAKGAFDLTIYRAFFAARRLGPRRAALRALVTVPGSLLNVLLLLRFRLGGAALGLMGYDLTRGRYANAIGRWLAR